LKITVISYPLHSQLFQQLDTRHSQSSISFSGITRSHLLDLHRHHR